MLLLLGELPAVGVCVDVEMSGLASSIFFLLLLPFFSLLMTADDGVMR